MRQEGCNRQTAYWLQVNRHKDGRSITQAEYNGKSPAFSAVFEKENYFDAEIHFSAFKAAGESVKLPLKYFKNNIDSLLNLLDCMEQYQCRNIAYLFQCYFADTKIKVVSNINIALCIKC